MSRPSGKLVSRRVFLKSASLAAASAIALSGLVNKAEANVPTVLQIENISQDSMGKINVEIAHANYSSSHWVDLVEVDVNGQVEQFSLCASCPQTSDSFTVLELDIGPIQGIPNVKARAHCTLHGWGPWSSEYAIPEFPTTAMAVFMALAASLFMIKKAKKN